MRTRSRRTRWPIRLLAGLALLVVLGLALAWSWRAERTRPAATAPAPDTVRIIAHRGGADLAPENTLAAVALAIAHEVDGIEVDVRLTRDGVPVLMHDPDLARTTDGAGLVADHDLAALATLDAGAWFAPEFAGEPVSTLDRVLALVDGRAELCVEVKGGEAAHPGITAATVAAIDRHGARPWCWLLSFHDGVLDSAATLAPDLRRTKLAMGRLPGLGLSIDHRLRRGAPWPARGIQAAAINRHLATGPWTDALHARGLEVWIWTLRDADAHRRAIAHGADALITDHPVRARQVLSRAETSAPTP